MSYLTTTNLTGGSSAYYKITLKDGIVIDLLDIIESLGLNFNEGNIFKAVMRRAMNRMGLGKQGTTAKYDAEKMVFFSERELAREDQPQEDIEDDGFQTLHVSAPHVPCDCAAGSHPGSLHTERCARTQLWLDR